MMLLGVVIGKCEMSSTHIPPENEHACNTRRQMSMYVVHLTYYIDTDIYARFSSYEKPFRDLFLTSVI